MSRRGIPETRSKREGYNRVYSRKLDCWNCGLPHHKSKNCTAEKILRCSFCRRKGLRSDECNCVERRRVEKKREIKTGYNREQGGSENSYEACLMISIFGKKVRAVVRSGEQESRIGRKVLTWISENSEVSPKKRVTKNVAGLELANTILVEMGVHSQERVPIECIIDSRLPVNEMTLGMKALVKFGYRFKIAGIETTQRKIFRKPIKADFGRKRRQAERPLSDDGSVYSQDDERSDRKREWKY